jgi:hypothetical protein
MYVMMQSVPFLGALRVFKLKFLLVGDDNIGFVKYSGLVSIIYESYTY